MTNRGAYDNKSIYPINLRQQVYSPDQTSPPNAQPAQVYSEPQTQYGFQNQPAQVYSKPQTQYGFRNQPAQLYSEPQTQYGSQNEPENSPENSSGLSTHAAVSLNSPAPAANSPQNSEWTIKTCCSKLNSCIYNATGMRTRGPNTKDMKICGYLLCIVAFFIGGMGAALLVIWIEVSVQAILVFFTGLFCIITAKKAESVGGLNNSGILLTLGTTVYSIYIISQMCILPQTPAGTYTGVLPLKISVVLSVAAVVAMVIAATVFVRNKIRLRNEESL